MTEAELIEELTSVCRELADTRQVVEKQEGLITDMSQRLEKDLRVLAALGVVKSRWTSQADSLRTGLPVVLVSSGDLRQAAQLDLCAHELAAAIEAEAGA